MAANRAFRGLANLRESFDQPYAEDEVITEMPVEVAPDPRRTRSTNITSMPQPTASHSSQTSMERHALQMTPVSPITGKVDRRRLKKVLKTPSVSLSVAVRSELHEEVSTMLFARKTTWIAILDELLTNYVSEARTNGMFPK
jgi:hypothetical protein